MPYVLSQLTGSYQSVPDFLDSQHKVDTRADAEAYISRLEAFARNVDLEVEHARADAGRGVVPPDFILDKTITQTRSLRGESGEQADLVQSLVRRAREKNIEGDWERQATAIVDGRLAAALDRQLALLTELRRGAGHNPGGGPAARRRAASTLSACATTRRTGLTPDEVHEIGLRQIAELGAQAEPLLRAEGLTQGSVGARITALGRQERYLYPNTEAGRAQLIADLTAVDEPYQGAHAGLFRDDPALADGDQARARSDRARRAARLCDGAEPRRLAARRLLHQPARHPLWPKWALPTLTYHEAIPGHLWQGSIVLENQSIPLLHRNIGIAAYGEGWGLYAEQLADEMGMYADYPVGKIGMIQSFMYRAARLVIDTGMHAKGWSREQAIRYFMENVGLDELRSTSEIERYVVWPGQACSYKIGHNEFVRLREEARRQLGDRFDLKGFHDAVLLNSDMPLEVLATVVADWTRSRVG